MKSTHENIFLSLGSNVGRRYNNLQTAINYITKLKECKLLNMSKIYETKPMHFEEQRYFLNMMIQISTTYIPNELLESLQEIESKLGRNLASPKFHPRIIDIDIIMFDEFIISQDNLIIPHPRLHERVFVLVPLSDINTKLKIPCFNKTSSELLLMLEYNKDIIKLYKN